MENNLKAILKKQKIKQVDLANGIGVSTGTISKICNGKSESDLKTLIDISDYLHIPLDSILKKNDSTCIVMSSEDATTVFKLQEQINNIYKKYLTINSNVENIRKK